MFLLKHLAEEMSLHRKKRRYRFYLSFFLSSSYLSSPRRSRKSKKLKHTHKKRIIDLYGSYIIDRNIPLLRLIIFIQHRNLIRFERKPPNIQINHLVHHPSKDSGSDPEQKPGPSIKLLTKSSDCYRRCVRDLRKIIYFSQIFKLS